MLLPADIGTPTNHLPFKICVTLTSSFHCYSRSNVDFELSLLFKVKCDGDIELLIEDFLSQFLKELHSKFYVTLTLSFHCYSTSNVHFELSLLFKVKCDGDIELLI